MSNMIKPFSVLPVFGEFDRRFNKLLGDDFLFNDMEELGWQPRVDIVDEEKQLVVKADIPGVAPEQVEVQFDNNVLTIKGKRETECENKKDNFICYERQRGAFYRRIVLPDIVDGEHIIAKSDHGVLVITLPKLKQNITKKITVQPG